MTGFSVPPRGNKELLWLAVDLDGTLAEPVWTPDNPTSAIGDPIKVNVTKLREAVARGFKAVVHTSRPWGDVEAIELWAAKHDIPISRVVCGKLLANLYIDDKARPADSSSWLP